VPYIGVQPTYEKEPVTGLILPNNKPTLITDRGEIIAMEIDIDGLKPGSSIHRVGKIEQRQYEELMHKYGNTGPDSIRALMMVIKYGEAIVTFKPVLSKETFIALGIHFLNKEMFFQSITIIPEDTLHITAKLMV